MLGLLVILFIVFFSIAVLLWAGTLGLQGLIYNDVAAGLHWRAPAASGLVMALLAVWCFIDYRAALADPETAQLPLETIFRFTPKESRPPAKKLVAVKNGQETEFFRKESGEYRDRFNNGWSRADTNGITEQIIIDEGGQRIHFAPKLRDGSFVDTREAFPPYYEVSGGRVMEQIGQVTQFRWGLWLLNLFFNFVHFGLWFVGLWLLLKYQWPHALGLAVAIWVVMTLVPLPMMLERTRDGARAKALPAPTTQREFAWPVVG